MEHKHMSTERKLSLLEKAIAFLGGLFLGAFIMMMLLKIVTSYWGAMIGLVINIIAALYLLKKHKRGSQLAVAAYGLLASVGLTVVIAVGLWSFLQAAFQGIAN